MLACSFKSALYYVYFIHLILLCVKSSTYFIRLNLWLQLDHLVLALPGAHFLGLQCGLGGVEN